VSEEYVTAFIDGAFWHRRENMMMVSSTPPTAVAEAVILRTLSSLNRPGNLTQDIKPAFDDQPPEVVGKITLALWNLRKRGDIRRIGRGQGMYSI
jgi:hypothetical protein